jgi:hypothetical protein
MPHEVLDAIKPWVKTFSAEISMKNKHGDNVCVGGIIKRITDCTDLFEDEDYDGYAYIYIDDDIGDMTLLVPKEIFKEISKEYDVKEGIIVLAEGKVMKPKGMPSPGVEIVCWNIYPLSTKKTEPQEE